MATDRLRRRLRSISPDTLSTLTSSQLCIVGTPLPSLTSHKRDADELKPIWQQEARDEQGRRRFHGAFTGGWSAGYFNTVGSKEGWTPGSFTSSRKDRAGDRAKESRVEDFMDEEDLEDWKNNQQVKRDTAGGAGAGLDQIAGLRTHANSGGQEDGHDSNVGLKSGEDIGYRLLKRMGWKPDQAIGNGSQKANAARSIASSSSVKLEDTYTPRTSRRGLGANDKPTLAQTLSRQHQPAPTPSSQSLTDTSDVWSDNRPLPSNFHLARQPLPSPPHFEPPPIPEGWQPDPAQITTFSSKPSATTNSLTPAGRAALLGEAKIPGPPPNIAAYLSEKARERLTSSSHLPLPSSSSSLPPLSIPRIDPSTAAQALSISSTTPPFPSDSAKQSRYVAYLESQCSRSTHQLEPPPDLTRSQYAMELDEFAKIAKIRPMSSTIASRFTKASAGAMEHELKATSVVGGLRQPLPSSAVEEEKQNVLVGVEKELSVAQKAAKMGNFGHLTRDVETWAPERLLCKRFGVPEPAVSRKRKEEERTSSSVQKPDFDDDPDPFYGSTRSSKSKSHAPRADQHWERNKQHLKSLAAGPTPLSLDAQASSSPNDTPHLPPGTEDVGQEDAIGMGDDERQGRDTLTYVKPSIDVYKAIFASDEEESAGEDDGGRDRATTRPKMQNPASGSGVVFQARSKRKDAEDEGEKLAAAATISPIATAQIEKKRKKDKATKKKSLLTFDLEEDDGAEPPAAAATPKDPSPKAKPKARVRASDLF